MWCSWGTTSLSLSTTSKLISVSFLGFIVQISCSDAEKMWEEVEELVFGCLYIIFGKKGI